jgi:hypothetical protein
MEPEVPGTVVTGLIVERTHLTEDCGERRVGEYLLRVADPTGRGSRHFVERPLRRPLSANPTVPPAHAAPFRRTV